MQDFDLRSPKQRILCCSACGEPVSAAPSGTKLELHCGYCNKEDLREVSADQGVVVERVYRGKTHTQRRKALALDMSEPPSGLEQFKQLRKKDRADLTNAWRASLDVSRDDADDGDVDQRITFLGLSLAAVLEQLHHDALRARATLETTFEHVRLPAFRGLVAARVAMLAARHGAVDVAEHWLDQVRTDVRVAEISSARRVTRALIQRAKNDWEGMLDTIGQGNTADEFVPPYRWTAVALRIDAHEHRGEHKMAFGLWQQVVKSGASKPLLAVSRVNGLAPITRKRVLGFGFSALASLMFLLGAAFMTVSSLVHNEPLAWWPIGAALTCALIVVAARAMMMP